MEAKKQMSLNFEHINKFVSLRILHFRQRVVSCFRNTALYPFLYRSYWHSILHRSPNIGNNQKITAYYTAIPHIGAGIGHQIANWNAGYWYAKVFRLNYAYMPFPTKKWDDFLGFGEREQHVEDLIKKEKYKKRRLPLFDNEQEMALNKKIIESYQGKKIIFVAEQDQTYSEHIGTIKDMKYKFHHAAYRKHDKSIYSKNEFNIAIHIRRGDIMKGSINEMRFQDNSYYVNILNAVLNTKIEKTISIFLFSQGKEEDFYDFKKYDNIRFCLEMNPHESFLHLVNADLLLTSKSSFSYVPALLSEGIKICPADFWHNYPDNNKWILADKNGNIDNQLLSCVLKNKE